VSAVGQKQPVAVEIKWFKTTRTESPDSCRGVNYLAIIFSGIRIKLLMARLPQCWGFEQKQSRAGDLFSLESERFFDKARRHLGNLVKSF
jgi:hypothetical protein